jgi:hypothetical protein
MPARLAEIVKMSAIYNANGSAIFSPIPKAVVVVTGATMQSHSSNALLKSSMIRRLPFNAFK